MSPILYESHLHHLEEETDTTNTFGSWPNSPMPPRRNFNQWCTIMKTSSSQLSIIGWLQTMCKFKVAEASEEIFELAENTWAVYSTRTINKNQVCQAKNMIQTQ